LGTGFWMCINVGVWLPDHALAMSAFHERGWPGIYVAHNPPPHFLLQERQLGDVNLQVALAD